MPSLCRCSHFYSAGAPNLPDMKHRAGVTLFTLLGSCLCLQAPYIENSLLHPSNSKHHISSHNECSISPHFFLLFGRCTCYVRNFFKKKKREMWQEQGQCHKPGYQRVPRSYDRSSIHVCTVIKCAAPRMLCCKHYRCLASSMEVRWLHSVNLLCDSYASPAGPSQYRRHGQCHLGECWQSCERE